MAKDKDLNIGETDPNKVLVTPTDILNESTKKVSLKKLEKTNKTLMEQVGIYQAEQAAAATASTVVQKSDLAVETLLVGDTHSKDTVQTPETIKEDEKKDDKGEENKEDIEKNDGDER